MDRDSPGDAANRVISVADGNGVELFEIEELVGSEAISRPFELALRLRRLRSNGKPPADLLGKPLVLRWHVGSAAVRSMSGMFCRLTRTSQQGRYLRYRAVFVPPIWPLTQNRTCRIFQDKTVPEILEELLHGYVADFRYAREKYVRRPQCIQYMESDFAFVQRLMEDEGIHYCFDHGRQSKLVIADNSKASPPIAEPKELRVRDSSGHVPQTGRILQLDVAEAMTIPKVRAVDYCFERKSGRLAADGACGPTTEIDSEQYRYRHDYGPEQGKLSIATFAADAHHFSEYGSNGEEKKDGLKDLEAAVQRRANHHGELIAMERKRLTATSDDWHIVPGFQFNLANAGANHDGAHLIIAIEHSYRLDEAKGWQLANRFECLPVNVTYRPPLRTPKPTMGGMHTAIVFGPEKTPTRTEHYGRVQLRFYWQNAERGAEHTAWVRVAQDWAGKEFGSVFTPRVGQQVLVEFVDDDPDRPVVIGCLYNAAQSTPYPLPSEAATSGFCSRSNADGAEVNQSNHLLFVDAPGKEQLHLHAQRHAHFSAEKAMEILVGWGADSAGEKSFLSANSPIEAPKKTATFKTSNHSGRARKVKGVDRTSVWGSQIDVTLGTSTDLNVGGWSQAHVGLGAALDIGLRVELMVGLHVELVLAPRFVFSVGKLCDLGTGTRTIKTGKAMTQVVKGDYIEKASGDRITMMGPGTPKRTIRGSSAAFQYFDVAGFRVCSNGPDPGSPAALAPEQPQPIVTPMKKLSPKIMERLKAREQMEMEGHVLKPFNLLPEHYVDDDPWIRTPAPIRDSFGTSFVADVGDVRIGTLDRKGKIRLCGPTIEIIAKQVNFCGDDTVTFDGVQATPLMEAANIEFTAKKASIHEAESAALKTAVETQIKATQAASWLSAAGAIPGVVVAGVALAGGIVAAVNHDPAEWGL